MSLQEDQLSTFSIFNLFLIFCYLREEVKEEKKLITVDLSYSPSKKEKKMIGLLTEEEVKELATQPTQDQEINYSQNGCYLYTDGRPITPTNGYFFFYFYLTYFLLLDLSLTWLLLNHGTPLPMSLLLLQHFLRSPKLLTMGVEKEKLIL